MSKTEKTSHRNASGSMKKILPMIILMIFMCISFVSATATNSTYVAGTGEALVYGGLNLILLFFLAGTFFVFLYFDNLIARVFSFGLAYLLVIAISFVGWQMANDFLTSPFLIEMFRIIFLVLIISAFPLLIGAFAWYLIMLFKIKEIENLMKHGMSQDEAEQRVSRRKR